MELQQERSIKACEYLGLYSTMEHYSYLAQQAAKHDQSYTDSLEALLDHEVIGRQQRRQKCLYGWQHSLP